MSAENDPKVLIVDLAKHYGGADVRVLELARRLHRGQYPYAVAALDGSPLYLRLAQEKLAVLKVPFSREDPGIALFLAGAIHQYGFKIVDSHNPQSQFWGRLAAMLAGAKVATTVHSAYRLEHAGSLKGRFYEQVLRLNNLGTGHFIAVSEAISRYLQNLGVGDARVSLIPNSVPIPEPPSRQQRGAVLKSLGWTDDAFVVICVGRLEAVKGHGVLLNALQLASAQTPELRCMIVGEGRMRAELEASTQRLGLNKNVQFTGFRDDIPLLLQSSDAFCLASFSEGLPFALLEAGVRSLPVLATKVGGMAALLTHQKNAFLVPPGDAQSLSQGLIWLTRHPENRRKLGRSLFELIESRFNCEEMVKNTIAVYQQLASTRLSTTVSEPFPSRMHVSRTQ